MILGIAELFNEEFPNVEVDLKPFSGEVAPTIANWFNAERVNPGTMPDIFWTTSFDMLVLSDKHVLLNLDGYIQAEEAEHLTQTIIMRNSGGSVRTDLTVDS